MIALVAFAIRILPHVCYVDLPAAKAVGGLVKKVKEPQNAYTMNGASLFTPPFTFKNIEAVLRVGGKLLPCFVATVYGPAWPLCHA